MNRKTANQLAWDLLLVLTEATDKPSDQLTVRLANLCRDYGVTTPTICGHLPVLPMLEALARAAVAGLEAEA